jgi:hypothetical protein
VFAHDETNVKITVCGSILNANSVDTCKEVAQEGVGAWLGTMYLIGIARNMHATYTTTPPRLSGRGGTTQSAVNPVSGTVLSKCVSAA